MADLPQEDSRQPSKPLFDPPEGDWADQAAERAGSGSGLGGKWQVPLFVLGLIVLLTGLPRLLQSPPEVPIDHQFADITSLVEADHSYSQAIDYINPLLEREDLSAAERSRLLLLRARCNFGLGEYERQTSRRGELAAAAQTDLAAAAELAGGIDKCDAAIISPSRFYLIRGKAAAWQTDVNAADRDLTLALQQTTDEQFEQRKYLVLALWDINPVTVRRELDAMLARSDLPIDERAWAAGRKATLLAEEDKVAEAVGLLEQVRNELPPGEAQDRLDVQQARIRYDAATSTLRPLPDRQRSQQLETALRTLMAVELRHKPSVTDLDTEAELNWLLGELHFMQDRPVQAREAFERVARLYSQSRFARAARLGLAKSLALYEQLKDNEALAAYREVVEELKVKGDDRLVDRRAVQGSLLELYKQLKEQQRWSAAWQFLVLLEQIIEPHNTDPSLIDIKENQARMLRNLAREQWARADVIRSELAAGRVPSTQPEAVDQLIGAGKGSMVKAGDAYLEAAYLANDDDRRSGEDLQNAAVCYDEAGELLRAIETLTRFIETHPADQNRVARAIFNLGKAYQAAGIFARAIEQYQRLVDEFPKAPDANKSLVPMAQCYKALNEFDKAQAILRKLLDDDETFRPDSAEFTEALFELAKLLYERGRYREAIARLDEALQRYPEHPQALYSLYYLADSYRRSGLALDEAIASAKTPMDRLELSQTRTRWLGRGRTLFDELVQKVEERAGPDGEMSELDWLYLRNSYFFRADCMFDLEQYEEAIWLYDLAALKYHGQPEAVAAFVQIVNCYQRLGKPEQARTANERAKWLLKKLPASGFTDRPLPLNKDYFAQWLQWAGEAGMW